MAIGLSNCGFIPKLNFFLGDIISISAKSKGS